MFFIFYQTHISYKNRQGYSAATCENAYATIVEAFLAFYLLDTVNFYALYSNCIKFIYPDNG